MKKSSVSQIVFALVTFKSSDSVCLRRRVSFLLLLCCTGTFWGEAQVIWRRRPLLISECLALKPRNNGHQQCLWALYITLLDRQCLHLIGISFFPKRLCHQYGHKIAHCVFYFEIFTVYVGGFFCYYV